MSLRSTMLLLSLSWLAAVLLLFNIFTSYYFVRETTNHEMRLLWNQAQIMLRTPTIPDPANWSKQELLLEFMSPNRLIRLIGTDGTVLAEQVSNPRLSELEPVYRTDYYSVILNDGGVRRLYIQVPIMYRGQQVGVLELGRALDLLDQYTELLVTTLGIGSAGVIVFTLGAAIFFGKYMFAPLRQLSDTMGLIRRNGSFERIGSFITRRSDEIGVLGKTFNDMITQLEDNYVRQKHFIEDASHELRTPLTVIESFAELLMRWGADDPAVRKEAVEAIHSEATHLRGLVDSLMKLTEGMREDGSREGWKTVELKRLAVETAKTLEQAFSRTIRVESGGAETYSVFGHRAKLKQLLIILLDNALKYSEAPILVALSAVGGTVRLTVEDYGIGIDEANIPRLFDRFYRVDAARSRETGGAGLGLSIAGQIVRLHGGQISVDSAVKQGTVMTVLLPAASPQPAPSV